MPSASLMPAERARPDKHHAIINAASHVFLAEGFDRASIDQIAQRAGVAKQTIYSHFADKEALFKAICAELAEKLALPLREPSEVAGGLRSVLIRLGEDMLALMLEPASLDLHRLLVSAAPRFPELGRSAYEAGPGRMVEAVATLLAQCSRAGDGIVRSLSDAEAERLAEQFIGMLRGLHQVRGLLGMEQADAMARTAYVEASVELVLRAT